MKLFLHQFVLSTLYSSPLDIDQFDSDKTYNICISSYYNQISNYYIEMNKLH